MASKLNNSKPSKNPSLINWLIFSDKRNEFVIVAANSSRAAKQLVK